MKRAALIETAPEICEAHRELDGLKRRRNGLCYGCERDRIIEARKELHARLKAEIDGGFTAEAIVEGRRFADEAPEPQLTRSTGGGSPGLKPTTVRHDPNDLIRRLRLSDAKARAALVEIVYRMSFKVLRTYPDEIRGEAMLRVCDALIDGGGIFAYDPALAKFSTFVASALTLAARHVKRRESYQRTENGQVRRHRKFVEVSTVSLSGDDAEQEHDVFDHLDAIQAKAGIEREQDTQADAGDKLDVKRRLAAVLKVLTPREREAMMLKAAGHSAQQGANAMGISVERYAELLAEARKKALALEAGEGNGGGHADR